MIRFLASTTLAAVAYLDAFRQLFIDQKDRTAFLDDNAAAYVVKYLAELDACLEKIDLSKSRKRIEEICYPLRAQTTQKWRRTSYDVVQSQLLGLSGTIYDELEEHSFAYIPKGNAQYFEQDALFGDAVNDKFKDAKADIKAAGNCLAADLHTAAVFHLMRVAEKGMKVLARRLKIKNVSKHKPLTLGTWKDIIKAIRDKIDALYATSPSPKRVKQLEVYGDLLNSLVGFKEQWRDSVSHERKSYDKYDAEKAMTYVSGFMKRLAELKK